MNRCEHCGREYGARPPDGRCPHCRKLLDSHPDHYRDESYDAGNFSFVAGVATGISDGTAMGALGAAAHPSPQPEPTPSPQPEPTPAPQPEPPAAAPSYSPMPDAPGSIGGPDGT